MRHTQVLEIVLIGVSDTLKSTFDGWAIIGRATAYTVTESGFIAINQIYNYIVALLTRVDFAA